MLHKSEWVSKANGKANDHGNMNQKTESAWVVPKANGWGRANSPKREQIPHSNNSLSSNIKQIMIILESIEIIHDWKIHWKAFLGPSDGWSRPKEPDLRRWNIKQNASQFFGANRMGIKSGAYHGSIFWWRGCLTLFAKKRVLIVGVSHKTF